MNSPLPLCAVSPTWRSIALTTPKLWQRVFVHLRLSAPHTTAESNAQELLRWIERSGSLPLTLFIWYYAEPCTAESGAGNPFLEVFNRYASRWTALYFHRRSGSVLAHCSPMEWFRVGGWSSLQRMYVVEPHQTVPWAQLTHLKIHCEVNYPQVVDIFNRCPKLVWLSLSIHVKSRFFYNSVSPITLHDLSFVSFSTNHLPAIVQLVSLPSLREISFSQSARENGSLTSLTHFLTRSACTLDKLTLKGSISSVPWFLIEILTHRSCNFLTSLAICQWPRPLGPALIDSEVLRRLTLHRDNSVCTHLKSLTLYFQSSEASLLALLDLVKSRIGSRTGQLSEGLLQKLQLHIDDFDLDDEKRLDKIVKRSAMEYEMREIDSDDIYSSKLVRRRFV